MERNLVGKNEQDLVKFGDIRSEGEGGLKDPSFSGLDHWVIDKGSNHWLGPLGG